MEAVRSRRGNEALLTGKLDWNDEFQRATNLLEAGRSVFITGKAGTGKSTGHAQPSKSLTIARALSAAQWLDELCSQWQSFEETRLSSSWLSELDGPGTRALPVVVSQSDPHS